MIAVRCENCGTDIPAKARFCRICGTPVDRDHKEKDIINDKDLTEAEKHNIELTENIDIRKIALIKEEAEALTKKASRFGLQDVSDDDNQYNQNTQTFNVEVLPGSMDTLSLGTESSKKVADILKEMNGDAANESSEPEVKIGDNNNAVLTSYLSGQNSSEDNNKTDRVAVADLLRPDETIFPKSETATKTTSEVDDLLLNKDNSTSEDLLDASIPSSASFNDQQNQVQGDELLNENEDKNIENNETESDENNFSNDGDNDVISNIEDNTEAVENNDEGNDNSDISEEPEKQMASAEDQLTELLPEEQVSKDSADDSIEEPKEDNPDESKLHEETSEEDHSTLESDVEENDSKADDSEKESTEELSEELDDTNSLEEDKRVEDLTEESDSQENNNENEEVSEENSTEVLELQDDNEKEIDVKSTSDSEDESKEEFNEDEKSEDVSVDDNSTAEEDLETSESETSKEEVDSEQLDESIDEETSDEGDGETPELQEENDESENNQDENNQSGDTEEVLNEKADETEITLDTISMPSVDELFDEEKTHQEDNQKDIDEKSTSDSEEELQEEGKVVSEQEEKDNHEESNDGKKTSNLTSNEEFVAQNKKTSKSLPILVLVILLLASIAWLVYYWLINEDNTKKISRLEDNKEELNVKINSLENEIKAKDNEKKTFIFNGYSMSLNDYSIYNRSVVTTVDNYNVKISIGLNQKYSTLSSSKTRTTTRNSYTKLGFTVSQGIQSINNVNYVVYDLTDKQGHNYLIAYTALTPQDSIGFVISGQQKVSYDVLQSLNTIVSTTKKDTTYSVSNIEAFGN